MEKPKRVFDPDPHTIPAFPKGAERKSQEAAESALRQKVLGSTSEEKQAYIDANYTWKDSSLDFPRDYPLRYFHGTFSDTFTDILPDGDMRLGDYLEKALENKKGKAVGIEFGGPGIELFKGFSEGFFEDTLGVTLADSRSEDEKSTERNHKVLEADILDETTDEKIKEWLQGRKVSMILERMGAGLQIMPHDPFLAGTILKKWYELLDEESIMMVQVPVDFNLVLKAWADRLEAEQHALEIKYALGKSDSVAHAQTTLMIRKLKGAPETIPLLSAREVYKA